MRLSGTVVVNIYNYRLIKEIYFKKKVNFDLFGDK